MALLSHKPLQTYKEWSTGGTKTIPWSGLLALFTAVVCGIAALVTLLHSNGRDINSWPSTRYTLQPTVILAILSAVANSALRYALAESLALFWWRQALNGATLKELHLSWAYATSFSKSLLSCKRFNTVALACIITTLVAVDGPLLQRSSSVTTTFTSRNVTITTQLSTQDIPYGYSGVIPVRYFNPTTLTKEFGQIVNDYQSRNDIQLNATGCKGVCKTRVVAPGFDERCIEGTIPYNLTINQGPDGRFKGSVHNMSIGGISFSRRNSAEFNASVKYKDDSACDGVLHTVDCTFRLATVSYPITIANSTVTLRPAGANDSLSITSVRDEGGSIADQFSTAGGFYLVANQLFGSSIYLVSHMPFWTVEGNGSMRYTYQTVQNIEQYNNCSITYSNPMPDIRSTLRELIFRASIGLSNSSTLQTTPGTEEVGLVVYHLNPYYLLAGLSIMLANVVAVLPLYFGWWRLGRVVSMSPLETAKAFSSPLMAQAGSNQELDGLVRAVGGKKVRYGAATAEGGGLDERVQSDCQLPYAQSLSEHSNQHLIDDRESGRRGFSGAETIPLRTFEDEESVDAVSAVSGGGYGEIDTGSRLVLCLAEEKDGAPSPPLHGNVYC